MLHWVSACTGSWGLGILGAKNCLSAARCGMLLILAKARWATMNKPFPQYQGKTSQTWHIWTFKIYFIPLENGWSCLLWGGTQPISVQFSAEKSNTEHIFCAELQGRAPSFQHWSMVHSKWWYKAFPEPWAAVDQQQHFGQLAYLCTQYPCRPCHHIPTHSNCAVTLLKLVPPASIGWRQGWNPIICKNNVLLGKVWPQGRCQAQVPKCSPQLAL